MTDRRVLWGRCIPMRDGVECVADVYLPPGDGPFPTLVSRTPYGRGGTAWGEGWLRFVERGYALVKVDVRGRGDSGGEFTAFVEDSADGYDCIEWAAAQPWSTGDIGMVGVSYEAVTQWWTARSRPPHLRCIAPMAVGVARFGDRPFMDTGIPNLYWIWWMHLVTGRTWQHPGAPSWSASFETVPVRTLHERIGTSRKHWPMYVDGEIGYLSDDWALSEADWAAYDVPTLVGIGWWDDQTTMHDWMAVMGSPAAARSRLLIGAWDHGGNANPRPVLGGLDVSASDISTIDHVDRFLAEHLKPGTVVDPVPPVTVFRTGSMEWETPAAWPAPEAEPTLWRFGPEGMLSPDADAQGSSSYTHDPADPARDYLDLDALAWSDPPLDGRYKLRRHDTVVFRSEPLDEPVRLSGLISFDGYVSLDAVDADLRIDVYDVQPDERAIRFNGETGYGTVRLSRREGTEERFLTPGEIVHVTAPTIWLHHEFGVGHRIVVSVSSSNLPNAVPNRGTDVPWPDATESRPVTITVHHDAEHPSGVVLPVEPKGGIR